eukprot:TRINITY_DN11297_c0_g1_i1.p1 TRINITY_DN11297_c0_g1~~TRINITY_DN11297_c0_g1_i1.p1  ORF type:complete len:454 (-),score=62.38 TRINITY_DN11297_c0_g1_i1:61-1422(-)
MASALLTPRLPTLVSVQTEARARAANAPRARGPSKLEIAVGAVNVANERVGGINSNIVDTKRCLESKRGEYQQLSIEANNLKDACACLSPLRNSLRAQLDESFEEIAKRRIDLQTVQAERAELDSSIAEISSRLQRLRGLHGLLGVAGESVKLGKTSISDSACAGESNCRVAMRAGEVRELEDELAAARAIAESARMDEDAEVVENAEQNAILVEQALKEAREELDSTDDDGLAAILHESCLVAEQSGEDLKENIRTVASKSVDFDSERELLDKERAKVKDELENVKAKVPPPGVATRQLLSLHEEVLRLTSQRNALRERLFFQREQNERLVTRDRATTAEISATRATHDQMRILAATELSSVQKKFSPTNRVRERIALQGQMDQRQLIGLVSAHSRVVAVGGRSTLLEDSGGLLDPVSSDMLALTSARQAHRLQTPRTGLRETGHLVMRSSV